MAYHVIGDPTPDTKDMEVSYQEDAQDTEVATKHVIKRASPFAITKIQPILFLSKALTPTTARVKIKRRINNAAYELELPDVIKIYNVVSVAQLELAPPGDDPYRRDPYPELGPEEVDDNGIPVYTIEKLLDKRVNSNSIT
ncbi:hypothetical protein EG328_011588 [Venturia inaequalis]|uniref:Uncharacterized protein n=1 Tax=Venturia inaequalis TaxID=5025 RepID=A0A8H3YJZ7_VENIN|nr:hypothetical protein EG328_011588 [Venturia inaequalis]